MDFKAETIGGTGVQLRLGLMPDVCPMCRHAMQPKLLTATFAADRMIAKVVFRCAIHKCSEVFIGTYGVKNLLATNHFEIALVSLAPRTPESVQFPEAVTALSPTFQTIHDQAMAAESMQLDQLVGIGLRKALEFLVKDYVISQNPNDGVEIRKLLLGSCINKYVTDANVKLCASRAAWLGNDETHYTRLWETKDIGDLKTLVKLTVNWIDSSLMTAKYAVEMASKPPA